MKASEAKAALENMPDNRITRILAYLVRSGGGKGADHSEEISELRNRVEELESRLDAAESALGSETE